MLSSSFRIPCVSKNYEPPLQAKARSGRKPPIKKKRGGHGTERILSLPRMPHNKKTNTADQAVSYTVCTRAFRLTDRPTCPFGGKKDYKRRGHERGVLHPPKSRSKRYHILRPEDATNMPSGSRTFQNIVMKVAEMLAYLPR